METFFFAQYNYFVYKKLIQHFSCHQLLNILKVNTVKLDPSPINPPVPTYGFFLGGGGQRGWCKYDESTTG